MRAGNYRLPSAADVRQARNRGRVESAIVCLLAVAAALAIARAPASDVESELAQENAQAIAQAEAAREPCWDQLPMRKAPTQENINRLCVKPQPMQAARVGKLGERE